MENQKNATPGWIRTKYSLELYGNVTSASWSLFDVRLAVGQLVPRQMDTAAAVFDIVEQGTITMAWPQVKVLRDQLAALVAAYEAANGEIAKLKLVQLPSPVADPNAEVSGQRYKN